MTISGAGSPNVSTTTAAPGVGAGTYILTGFGAGSYTVTPTKIGGANAISSFDAARVAQHVAGVPPLLNSTQLIAADTSGNGAVNSFDAALIAQYVVSSSGGQTGSWKFQPANRSYPSVAASITGEDYNAILVGEVSGNWNNTGARAATRLPESSIEIDAPHEVINTGSDIAIPVEVKGIAGKGIISYEFELRYDPSVILPQAMPVDVAKTVSGGLSVVANADEPGLLRVAVFGPMPIKDDGILFNLRFTSVGSSDAVSPLTWERMMFNESSLKVVMSDGQIVSSTAATDLTEIIGMPESATRVF